MVRIFKSGSLLPVLMFFKFNVLLSLAETVFPSSRFLSFIRQEEDHSPRGVFPFITFKELDPLDSLLSKARHSKFAE